MNFEHPLSPELEAIDKQMEEIAKKINAKTFNDPRINKAETRKEFDEMLKEISESHEKLIEKIKSEISDDFVPPTVAFKMGMLRYANGIKSLVLLANLIEKSKKS